MTPATRSIFKVFSQIQIVIPVRFTSPDKFINLWYAQKKDPYFFRHRESRFRDP